MKKGVGVRESKVLTERLNHEKVHVDPEPLFRERSNNLFGLRANDVPEIKDMTMEWCNMFFLDAYLNATMNSEEQKFIMEENYCDF